MAQEEAVWGSEDWAKLRRAGLCMVLTLLGLGLRDLRCFPQRDEELKQGSGRLISL